MNAGRDVERLIAGWLAEEAPGHAPDRILDAAGRAIDRTRQRRFVAAWREPMYVTTRGLLAAALAVALIGGAAFLFGGPTGPGTTPTLTPTPSPSISAAPTAIPAPIPPGTYAADVSVESILTSLADDATLTEEEKTAIIDEILSIRGATTLNLQLVIIADSLTLLQGTDGGPKYTNPAWGLSTLDEDTIAVRRPDGAPVTRFDVTWSDDSFTLTSLSPARSLVEGFVGHIVFEVAPYTLVP